MEWLRRWFRAEKKKLTGYSLPEIAEYIWEYYRLWLLGIFSVLAVLGMVLFRLLFTPGENWFYAGFCNTYADIGQDSGFCQDFARYAGYDLKEKNLLFNAELYCRPSQSTYGNRYYETLVSLLDGGVLDVVVMEEADIAVLGAQGRLLDLTDTRLGEDFADEWQQRFVYCQPYREEDADQTLVAVGIDLRGTPLVGEYCAYPEGAVLGVSAQVPHPEQVSQFLSYCFAEESQ